MFAFDAALPFSRNLLIQLTSILTGQASIQTDQLLLYQLFNILNITPECVCNSLDGKWIKISINMSSQFSSFFLETWPQTVPWQRVEQWVSPAQHPSSRGPWCSGRVGSTFPLGYRGIVWPRSGLLEYSTPLIIGSLMEHNRGLPIFQNHWGRSVKTRSSSSYILATTEETCLRMMLIQKKAKAQDSKSLDGIIGTLGSGGA